MKKLKKLLCCIVAALSCVTFSACDLGGMMDDIGFPSDGIFGDGGDTDSGDGSSDSGSDSSGDTGGSDETSSDDTASGSGDPSDGSSSGEEPSDSGDEPDTPVDIVTHELSIHFPFLGNVTSGDCALIKVGDTEVLIDAGSTTGSPATTVPYIRQYCTDGILEYVIATHGDSDHISGFVGGSAAGIFASFECGTIIDFPQTTKTKTSENTQVYNNYVALRDAEVEAGAVHYTALECWNNANGAKRSYELGEDITLNILYQKYYETSSSIENNYSVCLMITQGENNYLFTGDLEESGEESLVKSNDLPKCTLYKAGHHGSNTASSKTLIDVIQPEIVVACCCCGDKYDFPHQEFIDNIAPYTDKLYIPSMKKADKTSALLNGNIVVWSDGKEVTVNCSNNNTLFKDTEWFKENRQTPEKWLN
ncbi:MAG: MBL fold metallo-hydrolase [Clostridia bacterium]|nr:MBL fold metallo-hydrolase [Clostridia bacterium]